MSATELFLQLSNNIALLVTITFVYGLLKSLLKRIRSWVGPVVQGLLFGMFGIVALLDTIEITPGFLLDGRNVILVIAGIFGGAIPALIAASMVSIYRIGLGGAGVAPAIASAYTAALLGIWVYRYQKSDLIGKSAIPRFLVLGVVIALQQELWVTVLTGSRGREFIETTTIPTFILYSIGTTLLGSLLLRQERQHQTETALGESEARYRRLAENAQDLIYRYRLSPTRGFEYVSPSATTITGYTPEEHYADPELGFKLIHPEDQALLEQLTDPQDLSRPLVLRWVRKDGQIVWTEQRNVPIFDDAGKLIGLEGIARDITERKQAEEAIRESEGRATAIIESAGDAFVAMDAQGVITDWNSQAANIFGWGREEAVGRELAETIIPPAYREAHRQGLERFLATGEGTVINKRIEMTAQHRNGHEFPVELSITPIKRQDRYTFTAFLHDITERKQAEGRFRSLLESAPDAMLIVNRDGDIVLVNSQTERVFGYSRAELLGKPVETLVPEAMRSRHPAHRTGYTANPHVRGMGTELDLYAQRKDGSLFPVEISLSPIETEEGILVASTVRDITERKQAAEQMVELASERQRVRLLSDFVRDVSHDFRTPLSVVKTTLYMLERVTDPESWQPRLDTIDRQVDRLTQLVERLLIMTNLDNLTALQFERLDVVQLTQNIGTTMQTLAQEKGVTLRVVSDTPLPPVHGDARQLTQAVIEVVHNAIQFTPEGGMVTLRTAPMDEKVGIEVHDTGRGIAPDDLPRIFERLYRGDKSRSPDTGGFGLGLPITRRIIELHGGAVHVESILGTGSVFRIALPPMPAVDK